MLVSVEGDLASVYGQTETGLGICNKQPHWSVPLEYFIILTREGFLSKNIVAVSFFSKLCYTPIHVHIFSIN